MAARCDYDYLSIRGHPHHQRIVKVTVRTLRCTQFKGQGRMPSSSSEAGNGLTEAKISRPDQSWGLAGEKAPSQGGSSMDHILHNQLLPFLYRGLLHFPVAEHAGQRGDPRFRPRIAMTPDMGSDGVATQ